MTCLLRQTVVLMINKKDISKREREFIYHQWHMSNQIYLQANNIRCMRNIVHVLGVNSREWSTVQISGNVCFNPTPSRFQRFIPIPIPAPRFSQFSFPFPPQSHRLFPFPPAASPILVSHRTCCCFMCIMKQIIINLTKKLKEWKSFGIRTTENQITSANV